MSTLRHLTPPATLASTLILLSPQPLLAQQGELPHVEFFPGPVVSSNKIISMGGAYTAIAQGADAHLINPASFSNRPRQTSDPSWFSGDWTLSWFNDAPSSYADAQQGFGDSFHIDFGFDLKFGRLGLGLHGYQQGFTIERPASSQFIEVFAGYGGLGIGWSFLEEQLDVGLILGAASLTITERDTSTLQTHTYTSEGQGLTLGAHLALDDRPWQIGLRARREIRGYDLSEVSDQMGERRARITIPRQLTVGGAYDLPVRTYQGHPTTLLLSLDLVLTGSSEQAMRLDDFALAPDNASLPTQTHPTTLAPHMGAAYELLHNRLRLRAGSYWEPDRAPDEVGRPHITLGGEMRVHLVWDWRIDACIDLAPGYTNWGVGVGFWTPS